MPTQSPLFDSNTFQLIETLRWESEQGYIWLKEHLQRLESSAQQLGFVYSYPHIQRTLQSIELNPHFIYKVRLLLSKEGTCSLSTQIIDPSALGSLEPYSAPIQRCSLARVPVHSEDPFLRHKTTHRALYNRALEQAPYAEDVILYNERGELTETCTGNLVLECDGKLWTPPLSSGLLPGVMRTHLIRNHTLTERILYLHEWTSHTRLYAINSVRYWRQIRCIEEPTPDA